MTSYTQAIRGYASLMSIQSTPLSVGILLLGAASVEGTILSENWLGLVVVGATGHWSFYALNDLLDYEYDLKQRRWSKPLVAGHVNKRVTASLSAGLFLLSLTLAVAFLPIVAVPFYLIACLLGMQYNRKSKESDWAAIYLGVWAIVMVFVGALSAGGVEPPTVALMFVGFFHMVWMTLEGDLKDIDSEEASIPRAFDCKVKDNPPELWTSIRFNSLAWAVMATQIVSILAIPLLSPKNVSDIYSIYMTFFAVIAMAETADRILEHQLYDKDKIKRKIAAHEVSSVAAICFASLSFMTVESVAILLAGSVGWGLSIQTILYGHPLRFP